MGENIQSSGEIHTAYRIIAVEVAKAIAEGVTVCMGNDLCHYLGPWGNRICAFDGRMCDGTKYYSR
jgi:hypothetical protein